MNYKKKELWSSFIYIIIMNAFESLHKQSLNIPDWKKAERHAQATLVGRPLTSTHDI